MHAAFVFVCTCICGVCVCVKEGWGVCVWACVFVCVVYVQFSVALYPESTWTVRNREPRMATSTFTQLLSSAMVCGTT